MAAIQVHLNRVDHDDYHQVSSEYPILEWCRCGCGAIRDARRGREAEPFGVWAMNHQAPTGPYLCAACGTLALPTNSNLTDGNRFIHRGCTPQDAA